MPRVPGAVVALVGSLLAVVLFGLDRYGIAVVGRIPTGLPQLALPLPTLADFDDLLAVALAAALSSAQLQKFGAHISPCIDTGLSLSCPVA